MRRMHLLMPVMVSAVLFTFGTARGDHHDDDQVTYQGQERAQLGLLLEERDGEGLRIARVLPHGSGEQAGLRPGDRIVEIDGEEVETYRDLTRRLQEKQHGDELQIRVERNGREETIRTRLGRHPLGMHDHGQHDRDRHDHGQHHGAHEGRHDQQGHHDQQAEQRGMLGISLSEIEQRTTEISEVCPHSPADEAGLREGDEIVAIDGQPVQSDQEIQQRLHARRPGETVELRVRRNGEEQSVEATLATREQIIRRVLEQTGWDDEQMNGGRAAPQARAFQQQRQEHDRPELGLLITQYEEGVFVADVYPGSPADDAGVRPGDELTAIDGREVRSPRDVVRYLHRVADELDEIELEVVRNGRMQRFDVALARPDDLFFDGDRLTPYFEGRDDFERWREDHPRRETRRPEFAPQRHDGAAERGFLGVRVAEGPRGRVTVTAVMPGSPAFEAGLRPGDDLLAFEGRPVQSLRDFARQLDRTVPGDQVEFEVLRNGQRGTLDARLRDPREIHQEEPRRDREPTREGPYEHEEVEADV